MKKIFAIAGFVLFACAVGAGIFLMLRGNEDDWICRNGVWVKHGNPSAAMPLEPCTKDMDGMSQVDTKDGGQKQMIGGQTDEHGCLVAAGYSWCETKGKCLRTWEELCPKN